MRVFQPRAPCCGRAHGKNPGAFGVWRRSGRARGPSRCAQNPLKTGFSAVRAAAQRNFARAARAAGPFAPQPRPRRGGIQSRAGSSVRRVPRLRTVAHGCAQMREMRCNSAHSRGEAAQPSWADRRGVRQRACTRPSPAQRARARPNRRRAAAVSRGARAPGIRPTASRSGARRCARTRRSGARRGTARSARRRRCTPG